MQVIVATNEPWGTYHTRPLLHAAEAAGVTLRQWCPSPEHLPFDCPVPVTFDTHALRRADVVVVNGLACEHTVTAAEIAAAAGVPVVFSELAYLDGTPPTRRVPLAAVTCASPISRASVAASAGVSINEVAIVGSPALDDLPRWRPTPGQVLALTSVSEPTLTGGHHRDASRRLRNALVDLELLGYHVTVRPHPRENPANWERWEIDRSPSAAAAAARAECVVTIPGSTTPVCAALGVPVLGVTCDAIPDYLWHLAEPLRCGDDLSAAVRRARPLPHLRAHAICGPVGGSAGRTIAAWQAAAVPALAA